MQQQAALAKPQEESGEKDDEAFYWIKRHAGQDPAPEPNPKGLPHPSWDQPGLDSHNIIQHHMGWVFVSSATLLRVDAVSHRTAPPHRVICLRLGLQ